MKKCRHFSCGFTSYSIIVMIWSEALSQYYVLDIIRWDIVIQYCTSSSMHGLPTVHVDAFHGIHTTHDNQVSTSIKMPPGMQSLTGFPTCIAVKCDAKSKVAAGHPNACVGVLEIETSSGPCSWSQLVVWGSHVLALA